MAAVTPSAQAVDGAPSIAVTLDDFNQAETPLLGLDGRDTRIRGTLDRFSIRAGAFPAGRFVDNESGRKMLARWSGDGHLIGNHSYAHAYYDGSDPKTAEADLLKAEPLLSQLPGFERLFRFPFLAEGKTREGRDAMRAILAAHGYRNGHVTIDASDWYIDARMRKRLEVEPGADLAPYRDFYIAHLLERTAYYDGLSRAVVGHSVPHTLLLHHNLACAMFLDGLLTAFRDLGWRLISATDAFSDPVYRRQPDSLPAGQSLIWALAREAGEPGGPLRFPAEDGRYEAPRMDALGL
jgi:peptidoglycan/xylan/chitin deacetylase (PgdA/CDA1 family)